MNGPYEIPKCDICGQRLREDWEIEEGLCNRCIDAEGQKRDDAINSTRHFNPDDLQYGGCLWKRGEH